jgi:hypothetical protein
MTEDTSTTDAEPRSDPASPNAEAAGYRRRLRETEAERDVLAARVNAWRTAEVDRLAAEHLARGADLLELGGVDVEQLLDDAGMVDVERVGAEVAGLLETRPYLARRRFAGSADSGVRATPPAPAPTWHDVLGGTGS